MENIGLIIGFVLTLMVFSYVLGDNLLYRLAVYVFVGLVAGYMSVLTVESVLIPWFNTTLNSPDPALIVIGFIPLAVGLLLLVKSSSRLGRLGNLAIGLLIGIGASVAVVGALTGTLIPLALETATIQPDDAANSLMVFVGVIASLIYFQYIARRDASGAPRRVLPVQIFSVIGEGVIVITLGVIYAMAIITSLTIFSERMSFLLGGL